MTWKRSLIACTISILVAFPKNIFSCAGGDDPWDYYTSFFWNDQIDQEGLSPFYYTMMTRWYTEEDTPTVKELNLLEWKKFFGGKVDETNIFKFIYELSYKDLESFYGNIWKKAVFADSIEKNPMTNLFRQNEDRETLKYIVFAKKVEPFVIGNWDMWEPPKRDSIEMGNLLKEAQQQYTAAKKEDIKLRYAYQMMRLAQYSNRFGEGIKYYEDYVKNNPVNNFLKAVCLSHKAGCLYKTGKHKEAAYLFSQAFAQSPAKKMSNILGFNWSFSYETGLDEYLSLTKTPAEKANMLGMFVISSIKDESNTIKRIADLDPSSSLLQLLVTREINKLEENYFTPGNYTQNNYEATYYYISEDSAKMKEWQAAGKNLQKVLGSIASNNAVPNKDFFALAAAHTSYLLKDLSAADNNLNKAKSGKLSAKQLDQWNLTKLLVTIGQQKTIDANFEQKILPQLKWLEGKKDRDNRYAWERFYRNIFDQVLGHRYQEQKNNERAALIYGIDYVRTKMNTDEIVKLYNLFIKPKPTDFESYLIKNASYKKDDVIDVMGVSYLRDFNYAKAIEWFKKAGAQVELVSYDYDYNKGIDITTKVNPFHDYINDWQRYEKPIQKAYTRLTLAEKLQSLEKSLDTAKTNDTKAKIYYQLASGFYNMSYYGNSWRAVAYYRSTVEWNEGNYKTNWEKEHYGVYKAREYYQKAYELTSNKEFKAAAFFLVAKCAQRQLVRPPFDYNNYETYQSKMKVFEEKFKSNPLFGQFRKEFGTTAFYKRAFNTCSYLRDFAAKNK